MRRVVAAAACLAAMGCGRNGEPATAQAPAPPSAVVEVTTPPRNCIRLDLSPLKVVRVDEPQRRLFAAAPGTDERPLTARIRDLESCFELTEWAGRWHLSVFTDGDLAGYKDEPRLASAVADGRWARAYVAEYTAESKTLTRNPADSW